MGIAEVICTLTQLHLTLAAPSECLSGDIVDIFGVATFKGNFQMVRRHLRNDENSYDEIRLEDKSTGNDAFSGTYIHFGHGHCKDTVFGAYDGTNSARVDGKVPNLLDC